MGFVKSLGRARDKFIRGSIYRDAIKPMIMQNLMAAANPTTPMGGSGRYYRKKRRSYKGRGMYTGAGMYTGQGAYGTSRKNVFRGYGRYTPAANAIVSYGASGSSKSDMGIVPMFNAVNKDTVVISRREYVSEIYAPPFIGGTVVCEPFALQQFSINPGLEKTFRWLSQIAANFDEYELVQCIFTFKSTTTESGNQTNGQVGTVIMATNYNAAAPVFREKNTMMQYAGSVSSRLTETCIHGVECDPKLLSGSKGEYIRTNPVITNQDIKTYDHGLFQIAIANCTGNLANQSLGELWVSYTVKLRKPKFFTALGLGITKDLFKRNTAEPTTNSAAGPLFNTNFLSGQQNNLGCKLEDLTRISPIISRLVDVNSGILSLSSGTLANGPGFRLTIPAAYSGKLKIMFSIENNASAGALLTGSMSSITALPVPYDQGVSYLWFGTGNVRFLQDMYGAYDGTVEENGNPAGAYRLTPTHSLGICRSIGGTNGPSHGILIIAHVAVDIATNGIDNTILLYFGQSATSTGNATANFTTMIDASLDVSEYNAGFSYRSTGLGNSDAPVFVNQSGVIVGQF